MVELVAAPRMSALHEAIAAWPTSAGHDDDSSR